MCWSVVQARHVLLSVHFGPLHYPCCDGIVVRIRMRFLSCLACGAVVIIISGIIIVVIIIIVVTE